MKPAAVADTVDVCVVGSFMTDFTARVGRRPAPGETVIGEGLEISLGGKGFNQAVAAARSGSVTRMHGCLGQDEFGSRFRAAMAQDGIRSDTVVIDPHEGTGIGLPVLDRSGQNSIVVVPRANSRTAPECFAAVERAAGSCRVLLLQLEIPFDLTVQAARVARRAGATVVLNPAPAAQPLQELAGLADVLVPNRTEAAQLAASSVGGPEAAALFLRDVTGSAVIITLDSDGVIVLGSGDTSPTHIPAHPVESLDTIGAGDAFCGALAARLARGDELAGAAVYANAAGALCVTRPGASAAIPLEQEIEDLLRVGELGAVLGPT